MLSEDTDIKRRRLCCLARRNVVPDADTKTYLPFSGDSRYAISGDL